MSTTTDYGRYKTMIDRCTNPKSAAYPSYGGRGVKVCDRWLESFENFLADVGRAPKGMSLDRIDNNRGYEPGNVRWATAKQQARNRRRVRAVTPLPEWCALSLPG